MAQTINARVQFSTASLADWEKINPQLKEGELVLAKLDSGKYRLIVGAIGGSKFKDSVLVWDEVDAETLLANTEKASAAASASASAAKTSETNAKASETASKTSETNAKASETASKTSESNAKASETAPKTAEANAKTSAINAATSEGNAKASETASASSAKAADTSAQNAAKSSASAGSFASQAGDSAKAASTSAGNAATSETNAEASASSAKTSADNASGSASRASTSETNAKTSETNATASATNAGESATAAATSAKASADSASAAKTSETNAKASETASKSSETNAKESEANAKTSETNAAKSAEEAAASAKAAAEHDPKALIAEAHHYIQRNTAYAVGDVLTSPNLPYGTIIVVTQAGTTGQDEPDWTTIKNNMGGVIDYGGIKFILNDTLSKHAIGDIVYKPVNKIGEHEYLLPLDGQALDTTKYKRLIDYLGFPTLPDLNGRYLRADSNPNVMVDAGLPNITGWTRTTEWWGYPNTAKEGALLKESTENYFQAIYNNENIKKDRITLCDFNASRSSPVYGKSDTVTPLTYTVRAYICYA